MTGEEFSQVLEGRIFEMRRTLDSKAKEYASDKDRLHNFKRAGAALSVHPAQALLGMWVKHLVSIFDVVDGLSRGEGPPPEAVIQEKFGDSVNYTVLLEALVRECLDEWAVRRGDSAAERKGPAPPRGGSSTAPKRP